MKKTLIAVAVVIMFVMVVGPVYSQEYKLLPQREAFYGPIETTHWDKAKAYNGYVMFNRPYGSGNYVLIDMAGNVCHTWTKGGLYLLENGNILGTYTVERDPRGWMNYATSGFREIDWDSNVVYEVPPDPSRPLPKYSTAHHDYRIIWNKELGENTIISIANMMVSQEEAVALGADPRFDYSDSYCGGLMEHDMNGNLVWEWWWIDHTVQDRDPGLPNYGEIVEHPEKIDINWPTDEDRHVGPHFPNRIHQPGRGLSYDWQHPNSFDYEEDLGLIAINAKHPSEFYVIDHDGTFIPGDREGSLALAASDAGDFLYRFGNPSAYQQGRAPTYGETGHQQMWGAHNIQWIGTGVFNPFKHTGIELPGAGNFLIFDNGCYTPAQNRSRILEINPFISGIDEATGEPIISDSYVNPPEAGYRWQQPRGSIGTSNDEDEISRQVVWEFQPLILNDFYSTTMSSMQRLPNGNTFICATEHGHLFQVTPGVFGPSFINFSHFGHQDWINQEIVWEYLIPKAQFSPYFQWAGSYRALMYPPDYPGFAGKDLTPMGTITERTRFEALEGKLEALMAQ